VTQAAFTSHELEFANSTVNDPTGNESIPIIIINNTINLNLFFKLVSILLISNHNSFRVLFDKIASVYFALKYIYSQPR